jgi:hypothetical protein
MNSFAERYAVAADDDLIRLSADTVSLLPEARQALRVELEHRGLPISGVDWNAQPAPKLDSRNTVVMRRVFVVGLGVVVILLGPRALGHAVEFAKERYLFLSIGFALEALVEVATGILILMNHKAAIYLARATAVFLTLDALVGGLSPMYILQTILAWVGFFWYKSLRSSLERLILNSK